MHGFMKYTKVIVHEEKSADSEQVRREEWKFSWNDFCFLILGLPGPKHPPPKKKIKKKSTIISSFHLLVYIFIYLKILHLKSVS